MPESGGPKPLISWLCVCAHLDAPRLRRWDEAVMLGGGFILCSSAALAAR